MTFAARVASGTHAPRRRNELGLLFVGALVVLFASLLPSLALSNALPAHEIAFIAGLIGVGLIVQAANRLLVPDADPILLPVALVLNGLGYVMIERLDPTSAGQQLAWTVIGIGAYVATLMVIKRSRDLERYRYIMLFVAFGLLLSPLLPVLGGTTAGGNNLNGTKLWIHFGSTLEFQPVEIAKLLLVLFFASYFVEKRELFTISTRRVGNHLLPDLRAFGPIAVAAAMSLMVILAERDIGFALLLFVVFLGMLWVTTGRWTYLVIGLVAFVLATYVASRVLTVVNARIEIWLDPWKYYYTGGYYAGQQPVDGALAFGRGGLFGTGLGLGEPTTIPLPTSDFIFAAFGEELGLFGTTAIVVAFLMIAGAGFRAALRARSEFAKLAATGLTALLGFQAFFIFAGVARLLPLTGVTLPFVSYGGSSLLTNYILLALLMRISDEGNQPQDADGGAAAWNSTRLSAVTGTGRR
jgi:cell division protein FtsW (lipid II flippase)